jgi:molecular chaperone IbpA
MKNFDLAPLWRSTVGFDRLFHMMEDDSLRLAGEHNYPPYNIERTGEDSYRVTLALAGYRPEEIAITAEHDGFIVEGRKLEKSDHDYLHQGIAARPFRRVFSLADYVKVSGASFENGLLTIELVREIPEAMKPRKITIHSDTDREPKRMDQMKAA